MTEQESNQSKHFSLLQSPYKILRPCKQELSAFSIAIDSGLVNSVQCKRSHQSGQHGTCLALCGSVNTVLECLGYRKRHYRAYTFGTSIHQFSCHSKFRSCLDPSSNPYVPKQPLLCVVQQLIHGDVAFLCSCHSWCWYWLVTDDLFLFHAVMFSASQLEFVTSNSLCSWLLKLWLLYHYGD